MHGINVNVSKQDYSIFLIFTEEERNENMFTEETGLASWSAYNYCLCKRPDAKNLPENIGVRVRFLIDKNYLPELNSYKYHYPAEFVGERAKTIEKILKYDIWSLSLKSGNEGKRQ